MQAAATARLQRNKYILSEQCERVASLRSDSRKASRKIAFVTASRRGSRCGFAQGVLCKALSHVHYSNCFLVARYTLISLAQSSCPGRRGDDSILPVRARNCELEPATSGRFECSRSPALASSSAIGSFDAHCGCRKNLSHDIRLV